MNRGRLYMYKWQTIACSYKAWQVLAPAPAIQNIKSRLHACNAHHQPSVWPANIAYLQGEENEPHMSRFDWCCFYYFVKNSLVALLKALCARISSWDSWISGFFRHFPILFWFVCVQGLSIKAFLLPLSTRLLCIVVVITFLCWLYVCACVCVPLYMRVKICR